MLGRQVECLGGETDIVPLSYHIVDDFEIQFGREEFCLVNGLRFEVDYSADYKNEDDPIPFRRRVFSSAKDGKPITGLEDRRKVSDWILMLTNDRDCWDMYPWGSYVWPTLYSQLKNANVKRWHSLYAAEQEKVDDTKAYSVFGFTWAFKIWILESFRVGAHEYYRRQRRYPRVVSWSAKRKFSRNMLREPGDGVTSCTRRRHNLSSDGVTYFKTASARTDSNADLEDSSYDGVTTKT
ncbi:hypothetical protein Tco_0179083 [Tanacetum coccineum]